MRWTVIAGVAIIAIASSVLARSEYFLRTYDALHLTKPISMSPGRVSTEFSIDVSESYRIGIEFSESTAIAANTLDCLVGLAQWLPKVNCGGTHCVVNAKWTLYSDGSVVERGSSKQGNGYWSSGPAVTIGTFPGEEGHRYALDVDILTDGSQLAPTQLRLVIEVADFDYYEGRDIRRDLTRAGMGICILLGLFLTTRSLTRKARPK